MKSICLNCLVYTLKDKEVKDNMYLEIFYLWLTMLIKNGGLEKGDILNIHMDTITLDYLQTTETICQVLFDILPCEFKIYTFEPPGTSLKGMMQKYIFTEYTQDVYIYNDIDMYILKPLRSMFNELNTDTYYFIKGVSLDNKFYSEGFPSDFIQPDILPKLSGFNASLFIVTSKILRDRLFSRIHELCDYSSQYLCVEQPYFNRAIYEIPRNKVSVNIDFLSDYAKFFGEELNSKVVFLDFCGDTSNGIKHFTKMSGVMCLFLLDSLK